MTRKKLKDYEEASRSTILILVENTSELLKERLMKRCINTLELYYQ